jgi:hypothetical protein
MYADLALLQSGKSLQRARAIERKLASLTRLALVSGAAILIAVGFYYFLNQARLKQLRNEVSAREKEKRMADGVARKTRQDFANLCAITGEKLEAEHDLFGALLWLAEALDRDTDSAKKEAHAGQIEKLAERCPKARLFLTLPGRVNSAVFSPDGLRLITAGDDHTAQVWNASTGEPVGPPLKLAGPVFRASFDNDGQRVLTGSADGIAQVWNALTGEARTSPMEHGGKIVRASFSPDGRQVLTLGEKPMARIWDASSGRLRFTLEHTNQVLDGAFSGDGRYVPLPAPITPPKCGTPRRASSSRDRCHIHNRCLVSPSVATAAAWRPRADGRPMFGIRPAASRPTSS